jgi:hypothetical protein
LLYNQPYGVSDPNAPYINGNPTTGQMGSIPPAASIEHDQREVVEVINTANTRGYKDFSNTPCAAPSSADLMQLRKAIEGFVRGLPITFSDLIDTYVQFVVGPGGDFPDLIAALHYLSKYKITSTGRVVLQLTGAGASGPATIYTYTQTVIFDHPNNNRIFVLGAPLRSPPPTDATAFTLTGNSSGARAADTAANMTMLRNKYATELRFNNCNGIEIVGTCIGILSGVLITSNAAAGYIGVMVSAASTELNVNYLYNPGGSVGPSISTGQGVVVSGFDGGGFYFGQCGNASAYVLDFPAIALGNNFHGFWANAGASFQPGGRCLSFSNAQDGFLASFSWLFFDSSGNQAAYNGGNGVRGIQATVSIAGCALWGNVGWGIYADQGSTVDANLAVFSRSGVYNAAGDGFANHFTYVNVINSSGYRSPTPQFSPALNVLGNNQSLITYT